MAPWARSNACDLSEGRPVWTLFNAPRAEVLRHYRTTVDRLGAGDPRLESLAAACLTVLTEIEAEGAAGAAAMVEPAPK